MTTLLSDHASVQKRRGFRLSMADDFAERIRSEGLMSPEGYEDAIRRSRRVAGGRGSNWILEEQDQPIRVRPFRHGGILARWLQDRSLTPSRALREFSIWIALRQRKVSLPVPVFAMSRRRGLFWHSAFASLECANAQDGLEWLAEAHSPLQVHKACLAFVKALRQFHDAGAIHGDLQLRNVLLDWHDIDDLESTPNCMLIDLDRTRILSNISARQRMAELSRFLRSLEKTGHGEIATKRLRALAISTYCGGDRALRRAMMRWSRFEATKVWRHRIAWRIERAMPLRRLDVLSRRDRRN